MRRDGSTESLRKIAQIVYLDFGHFRRNNLCGVRGLSDYKSDEMFWRLQ
jgi:hypothetical protein